ncbi:MAG: TaqI family restriction endonuclease [Thermodesulfobacteria bacterium]|nr:TaqI family restriction endonuclease [Thermodesulfobacteriota bacterium]
MSKDVVKIIEKLYESFLPKLQIANWEKLTLKYEKFLKTIPLSEYRKNLQKIKTVEFDLSGKYRSLHLSLIYHLYWKRKFVVLINNDVPSRYKKLKNLANLLKDFNGKIPLYQLLGCLGFDSEEKFINWLYFKKYSKGVFPINFIELKQELISDNYMFPSFEDFWKEYKNNIDLNEFISQHQNFIDVEIIKSQIIQEIKKDQGLFILLKEEDVKTERTNELIKGYILVGLKARMYRTWISLLTQLDLSYIWNKTIDTIKMDSDVILDLKGVDIYGKVKDCFIGLQIKKRSRRHEALKITEGKTPINTVDIPYDLDFEKDEYLQDKLKRLENGFVVFTENYIRHIYEKFFK